MKIGILINPKARRFNPKQVHAIASYFRRKGHHIRVAFIKKRGDAEILARSLARDGFDVVAAHGGDGIVTDVAEGLIHTNTALAVLPAGTTDVFAQEMGIPRNALKASLLIEKGLKKKIYTGVINGNRHFLVMCGVGFDAMTIKTVSNKFKKWWGKLSYISSGLFHMLKYRGKQIDVKIDGEKERCFTLIIGNARRYGGGFSVTPNASVLKEKLDVCMFCGKGMGREVLFHALLIVLGFHLKLKSVKHQSFEKMEIFTPGISVHIDGDFFGFTPLTIEIEKDLLSVIVPQ
ncbi:MAG: YegS/Rv2252/BmrU family lipid kinase [Deltaproteobacteria bacterium]|nr:YegS/Rv2252/BmrU family lipid kinase [Deltaproteobacteria bacterium]